MNNNLSQKLCWVLTEGIAGTENQCLGVAEALGLTPLVKRITLREPWKTFSPTLGFEQWWTFNPELYAPWPDILIASGRKSIAAARYIKKMSHGKTFTVQIQDPRVDPSEFDLVAAPFHDGLSGPNVITTIAAPNRVTLDKLNTAKENFPQFGQYASPVLAVLIGGNSKTHSFTERNAQDLANALKASGASLLITMSRRTPKPVRTLLQRELDAPHIYIWDGEGENPYFAYLAYADAILVTSDSASMISEAATTGKPVYKFDLNGESEKFSRFYRKMQALNILRDFEGQVENWTYERLQDAQKVADAIRTQYIKREKT